MYNVIVSGALFQFNFDYLFFNLSVYLSVILIIVTYDLFCYTFFVLFPLLLKKFLFIFSSIPFSLYFIFCILYSFT